MAATSSRGLRSPVEVEAILDRVGITKLSYFSTSSEQAEAVTALGRAAAPLDKLERMLLRNAAVDALKLAKIASPAKLVDHGMRCAPAPKQTDHPSSITFPDVAPAETVMTGEELLDLVHRLLKTYVVIGDHEAVAVTLWIVLTYLHDVIAISARLAILSPSRRCGKTTLLKFLHALVHRGLPAANVSVAAVFRVLDTYGATLLIDEMDTFLRADTDLLGVLNAGHDRQQAFVIRCSEGASGIEPQTFRVWGAVAIAGIGRLPSTLADRSIAIHMKRRHTDTQRNPFRRREFDMVTVIRSSLVRWTRDHAQQIGDATIPEIPVTNDRAADGWEPLVAIAQAAGPKWLERALAAAHALTEGTQAAIEGDDLGERLLMDVRSLMDTGAVGQTIAMRSLSQLLVEMDDAPWGDVMQGRPLNPGHLGKLLRRFGIKSKPIRFKDAATQKGYAATDFKEAFERYLPDEPVTPVTPLESLPKSTKPRGLQGSDVTGRGSGKTTNGSARVTRVTGDNTQRRKRGRP